MSMDNRSIINRLLRSWPQGTVAVSAWLTRQGVYQQLTDTYVKTGWLRRLGHGAFVRCDDSVEWPGGVYALQNGLGLPVHVGGKTALELRGFGHFVPPGDGGRLCLFAQAGRKLPTWFLRHNWRRKVVFKMPALFGGKPDLGLTRHSFGRFDVTISSPELAILEMLHLVPGEESAEEALLLMEGLGTLRPALVQELLERCRSVKVKRLFLALAGRCNHAWVGKLKLEKVKLGSGKRSVVPGGVLDPKYLVTLPKPAEGS